MNYRVKFTYVSLSLLLVSCSFVTGCGNNIHRIGDTGHPIFRSAQLSGDKLTEVIKLNNIQAIINLNGVKPGHPAYEEEKKVVNELGIEYHDMYFDISNAKPWVKPSGDNPNKHMLLLLIQVLKKIKASKKPLLIHCKAGADRTSFGSALAEIIIHEKSVKEALEAFSHQYGHLCFGNCTFETLLNSYALFEDKMDIEAWVKQYYNPPNQVPTTKYVPPNPESE